MKESFQPHSLPYRLVRWLIFHIFPPVFRLIYGYRVVGKTPDNVVREGCVSVCNHVHMLDCVMLACAFRENIMQFLTLASNMRIPVAGRIVKLMGGIALPSDLAAWRGVCERIGNAMDGGQVLQIYPEGELESGCRELREFRPGAFIFAVKYRRPVIPCVLRFYPRYKGERRKRRDGLELVILPPVYPDERLSGKRAAQQMQKQVYERMKNALGQSSCAIRQRSGI